MREDGLKKLYCLKEEGYIENRESFLQELESIIGHSVDYDRFNKHVTDQKQSPDIYRYYDNTPAVSGTADMKVFDTGEYKETGEKVFARFRRRSKKYGDWVGVDFIPQSRIAIEPKDIINKDSFDCQIDIANKAIESELKFYLHSLIGEDNRFFGRTDEMYQYLKIVYFMCRKQGHIFEKENCQIFNTGLLDKTRNYIYACFTPNSKGVKPWRCHPPWICNGFGTVSGDSEVSRVIRSNIDKNLKDAQLPYDKFDPMLPINIEDNYEHCMVENALRIPEDVIRRAFTDKRQCESAIAFISALNAITDESFIELDKLVALHLGELFSRNLIRDYSHSNPHGKEAISKILIDLEVIGEDKKSSEYEKELCNLMKYLKADIGSSEDPKKPMAPILSGLFMKNLIRIISKKRNKGKDEIGVKENLGKMKQSIIRCYLRQLPDYKNMVLKLKKSLSDAIRASEAMINPSLAVPEYYPKFDSFGLFLPISFCDSHECLALVVVKDEQKPRYIGKTILTREMALNDAQLLQSDIPQWLQNKNDKE